MDVVYNAQVTLSYHFTVLAIQAKKKRYKHANKAKGRTREKDTCDDSSNKNNRTASKPSGR